LCLLFTVPVFAQTPTVLTLKASGVSSTETPEGSSQLSVSATLNGAVNANGTNCTVSFEYGNTTSYGNTVAVGTVTGSGDNGVNAAVTLNYTDTGPQERLIHYRVKVTNENGTYYGRDFVATPIFLMRDFWIDPPCSDSPTMANYDLTNNKYGVDFVTIYYVSGTYSGSALVASRQVQQIFVGKGAICSFYYRNTITRQIFTNDQTCSETAATWTKVFVTAVGTVGSGTQSQLFKVENANAVAVTLQVVNGSDIYTQVVPGRTVMYFAGDYAEASFTCDGIEFAVASPTNYKYEGMSWLAVNAISSTSTLASFELYNRDDAPHTFMLRNSGGTEYSYTLTPYEARNITLSNENWDVYTSVTDFTQLFFPPSYFPATFQTYGKTSLCYNGYLKVATAVPGTSLTPSISSASIASSTSLTLNGAIANSAFSSADVDYHFIYGTDPANLNQSTTAQSGTVQASGSLNVSATVTGLTQETLYYYKLVVEDETISAGGKIFLSTAIPTTNLKLHLRSDLAVTSASSTVSNWGDVSGWNNDASQGTSGNQPTITSSAMNGYPALSFNGSTSKLTLPTSTSLGMQSNPYELFIVARSSSSNVQFLIAGGANEQFEYHLNGVGARFIPTTTVYLDKGTAQNYTDGNTHLFSARASSSGGSVRINGIDGGTSISNILSSNSANLLLGVRSDGTYYLNGDIAEVIIYNRVLTHDERNKVEHYLAQRYLIAGMQMPEFTSTSFTTAEDSLFSGLLATDADHDVLSYTILADAQNGTSHIENDSLYYQPALNFNGADSLRISVSDGAYSDSAWVHITVTPVNDSPVARDTLITANTAIAITVSLPVSDVDGTIIAVIIDRQPGSGEAIIAGSTISYTSDAGFRGIDTLTWHAQDNVDAISNTATLIFNVVPLLPIDLAVADSTITLGNIACFDAENEIAVAGSSEVIVEEDASANFIAGYSVTFLPGFHASNGSYVHARITEDGTFCDVAEGSPIVAQPEVKSQNLENTKEILGIKDEIEIKVYPNPNNGQFTLELTNFESGATVCIYNMLGARVYQSTATNDASHKINLPGIKKGIYFVKVRDGKEQFTRKMVVN